MAVRIHSPFSTLYRNPCRMPPSQTFLVYKFVRLSALAIHQAVVTDLAQRGSRLPVASGQPAREQRHSLVTVTAFPALLLPEKLFAPLVLGSAGRVVETDFAAVFRASDCLGCFCLPCSGT